MSIVDSLRPRPGLRVLVTAGGAGIGAEIARGFVEAGARVHVSDVGDAALAAAAAAGMGATRADAGSEEDTHRLFTEARAELGGLDVVVANAGIAGPTSGVGDVAAEDWDATLDTNLRGVYLAARFAAPDLVASRGSFIAISSVAGRLGYAFRTPYAASKWGVVGLAKSLAAELGPQGVRANAILPGIVRGARIERVIAARAEQLGLSYAETETRYLEKVSLRRMVGPEDIAAMCLFLASPGGANISGQALSVCGNVEAL
ncbi:SDR family oxidoreductase [Rhodovulum euryhalinum]|uniref:NAD(P)-dependent dehydrogenase (Short-subunit alcohol dehydrogenase family) n=1 Tax=Rhodovulum euryhalinum TaxID=35805 RepID=A0A4R2KKJ3_9RHOB|nr:SDR family oxidoreductase [Rhodovulum euryhalinum]TCO74183.1 NAD(P)-dependent dehydrogenase (short-subunit alcohol dehydrogenase family) [Rhodovulum euryhalinum]